MVNITVDGRIANDEVYNMVARYLEGVDEIEYPPFNDDMTKDAMIAHIIDVHGHPRSINNKAFGKYGTKVTKDEMVAWHDRAHEMLESDDLKVIGRFADDLSVRRADGTGRRTLLPKVRHSHMSNVPLTPEQEKVVASAREGKRTEGVLTATERKVLTQVVDNDFGTLKQEMRAFVADSLAAKKSEITAEWDQKERSIPDFATGASAYKRERDEKLRILKAEYDASRKAVEDAYQDEHRKIVAAAQQQGVTLVAKDERYYDEQSQETRSRTVFTATVEGRNEALKAAEVESETMLNRALMDLERQRLTAQRQVLLSGVPEAAMTILDGIPDAKTLMVSSQRESKAAQIEARSTNQS